MIPCLRCDGPGPTIRGLCETCAPRLHENRRLWRGWVEGAMAAFAATTGRDALAHWYEFEQFQDKYATNAPPPPAPGGYEADLVGRLLP